MASLNKKMLAGSRSQCLTINKEMARLTWSEILVFLTLTFRLACLGKAWIAALMKAGLG